MIEVVETVLDGLELEEGLTGAKGKPRKGGSTSRKTRAQARQREEDGQRLRRMATYMVTAFAVSAQALAIGTMYRSHADLMRQENLQLERETGAVIATDRVLEERMLSAAEQDLARGRLVGVAVSQYMPATTTGHAFRYGNTRYMADFGVSRLDTALRVCTLAGYGRPLADLRDPHSIRFAALDRGAALDAARQIDGSLDRGKAAHAYDHARNLSLSRPMDWVSTPSPDRFRDVPNRFDERERMDLVQSWSHER